jgi:hypothetical protein
MPRTPVLVQLRLVSFRERQHFGNPRTDILGHFQPCLSGLGGLHCPTQHYAPDYLSRPFGLKS